MDDLPRPPAPPAGANRTAWQMAVPWIVLAAWLIIDLAVVIYWARTQWGFLGDILLIIALAFHVLGLLVWISAFAILARCHWGERLAYFLIGAASCVAMTDRIVDYRTQPPLVFALAALVVAWSLPFWWLRRRGWRIAVVSAATADSPVLGRPSLWQFGIGDILIATTQAAAFIALLLAVGFNAQELTNFALILVASPAVVLIALAWQQFWLAVVASLLLCVVFTLAPIWCFASNIRSEEMGLLLGVVAGDAVSLLLASGCLRLFGYRLR